MIFKVQRSLVNVKVIFPFLQMKSLKENLFNQMVENALLTEQILLRLIKWLKTHS